MVRAPFLEDLSHVRPREGQGAFLLQTVHLFRHEFDDLGDGYRWMCLKVTLRHCASFGVAFVVPSSCTRSQPCCLGTVNGGLAVWNFSIRHRAGVDLSQSSGLPQGILPDTVALAILHSSPVGSINSDDVKKRELQRPSE
jgi:hypothetical protein